MIFSVNIFRAFALYESFLLIMKVMLSGADRGGGGVKWVASHPPKHINLDFPLHIVISFIFGQVAGHVCMGTLCLRISQLI